MDVHDAMEKIRSIAREADLAVSMITVSDALSAKGIIVDEPTPEQITAVTSTWEWHHYGDNWSDWFAQMDLPE